MKNYRCQRCYGYHKAGIALLELRPKDSQQFSLFAPPCADERENKLMAVLDSVNQRHGRGTLKSAAEGIQKNWQMRRGNLSPRYTTEWSCLPKVRAK